MIYLIIWNILVFGLYGLDKKRSMKDQWRIPEKTLLLCAACFGSLGAYAGMKVFHHKTLHKKFVIGVPAMLIIHIGLLAYFYNK